MTSYQRFLQQMAALAASGGVLLGLDRLQRALAAFGSPERRLPAVHIAGTNGKGSTAAMTEAILHAAGLRTGLYTSPHLSRFTERIRIAGVEIDGAELARIGAAVLATGVPLTYFEVATGIAFVAMAEAQVELAVLEVGLGGRLDATNLCAPVATAITSIGLDHTDVLGATLAAIAREKAGICKPGVPLFLSTDATALPAEAADEIARVAAAVGAPVRLVAPVEAPARLPGGHQRGNTGLALALARAAGGALGRPVDDDAVARGLAGVAWPGRLERVAPDVLLDAAHNPDGARALLAALPPQRPRALVVSMVRGKDAREVLRLLVPAFDVVVYTRTASARALAPDELAALAPAGVGARQSTCDDPIAALAVARGAGGLVVGAGSIILVGELRAFLTGEPRDPIVTGDPGTVR